MGLSAQRHRSGIELKVLQGMMRVYMSPHLKTASTPYLKIRSSDVEGQRAMGWGGKALKDQRNAYP